MHAIFYIQFSFLPSNFTTHPLCHHFASTLLLFSFCNLWLFNSLKLNFSFYKKKVGLQKKIIWNNCSKSMNNETYLHFWNCYWVLNTFIAFCDWAYTGKSQIYHTLYSLPLSLTGRFSVKRLKLGIKNLLCSIVAY